MRRIKQDELFKSLNDFLKVKGIELTDGAYAGKIQRACNLLGDTINATQSKARKAKNEVVTKVSQVRQRIHEATAPKPPVTPAPKPGPAGAPKPKKPRPTPKKPAPSPKGKGKA